MPKNLTRHRRANKRGGQTVDAPYVAPAPAPMPTYVAPAAAPAPAEEGWFSGLGDKIGELGAKLDPRKLLPKSDPNAPPSAPSSSWFGGRKRMRAMRGGNVNASDPLSLATNASPISGISSARAHNWVGGRTRAQKRSRSRSQRRSRAQSRRRAQSRSRKYGRTRR
jgi:hypothetical protein